MAFQLWRLWRLVFCQGYKGNMPQHVVFPCWIGFCPIAALALFLIVKTSPQGFVANFGGVTWVP